VTRAFNLPGETLISVRGGAHASGSALGTLSELGLAKEGIKVTPEFVHQDIPVMGMGGVPADLQWRLGTVDITCSLLHFDPNLMEQLIDESMAQGGFVYLEEGQAVPEGVNQGNAIGDGVTFGRAGMTAPAGSLLWGRKPMYASGNHFFSVHMKFGGQPAPEVGGGPPFRDPYRFRKCILTQRPIIYELGTNVQQADLTFRAYPYQDPYRSGIYSGQTVFTATSHIVRDGITHSLRREILGSGAIIWDRIIDED